MTKILIVEDEKNIVKAMSILLNSEGFVVEVAEDGTEAIKKAQEFMPDLILLDIILPKLNGYLVCQALKEDPSTRHIPIIFVSAKAQKSEIEKAFAVGGADFVVKPFTPDQLRELLKKYAGEAGLHGKQAPTSNR